MDTSRDQEKKDYFVTVTEAARIVGIANSDICTAEKRLRELGITPAGYIKGERAGGVVYFRPFYDPADLDERHERRKIIEINKLRNEIDQAQRRIKQLEST